MTSAGLGRYAAEFRSAVEARAFSSAQAALEKYIACFRCRPRTLTEVDDARGLLQWGLQQTHVHKTQIAEELMLLKTVFEAYKPPRRVNTWRVEG
jgi:hypothetical protein